MHGHGKYTFLNLPKDNVFEGNFIDGEAEGDKKKRGGGGGDGGILQKQ